MYLLKDPLPEGRSEGKDGTKHPWGKRVGARILEANIDFQTLAHLEVVRLVAHGSRLSLAYSSSPVVFAPLPREARAVRSR